MLHISLLEQYLYNGYYFMKLKLASSQNNYQMLVCKNSYPEKHSSYLERDRLS
jgi:hypothetical protein